MYFVFIADVKDLVDLKPPTTNEGKLLRFCVMRKCDVVNPKMKLPPKFIKFVYILI